MARRILFVIRGKLGDSFIMYAVVAAYARWRPQDRVWLLVRRNYARLLEGDPHVRLIAFGSRLEMVLKLLWLRLTQPAFDILAVLWGFGKPVELVARIVRAGRKLYFLGSLPHLYPEFPSSERHDFQTDPARMVIQLFEPEFIAPDRLALPQLAARRRPDRVIGIAPLADELRRNLDFDALNGLLRWLRRQYPDRRIRIFLSRRDEVAGELLGRSYPPGVELKYFKELTELLDSFAELESWYGTDTGLYRLAAAFGIPATIFFGPTQPFKNILPGEPYTTRVRLAALGNDHCEVKNCSRPLCLHQAIANYTGEPCATRIEHTPAACPLRALPPEKLLADSVHENPRHQAR